MVGEHMCITNMFLNNFIMMANFLLNFYWLDIWEFTVDEGRRNATEWMVRIYFHKLRSFVRIRLTRHTSVTTKQYIFNNLLH